MSCAHAISVIPWSTKRAAPGANPADAPALLTALLGATDRATADAAVDGLLALAVADVIDLYEVGEGITAVILLSLAEYAAPSARRGALRWLDELTRTYAAPSEEDAGNSDLDRRLLRGVLASIERLYALADHPDAEIAADAIPIILCLDGDRDRVARALDGWERRPGLIGGFVHQLRELGAIGQTRDLSDP